MKQFASLFFIATVFTFCSSFIINNDIKPKAENARIDISFNRQLEFADIVKIKLDLSARGVVLNYKTLQFDENGKLKGIDFSVDCKDGFKGSASYEELSNQSTVGFYRDYKNADAPFGIRNH